MVTKQPVRRNGAVTKLDIANKCGVSMSAVTYAFKPGSKHISEENRKRVLQTAAELGYDAARNQSARRMAMQRHGVLVRNHAVCLMLPAISPFNDIATYHSRLQAGVMSVMNEGAYGVQLAAAPFAADPIPMSLTSGEVDGVLSVLESAWMATIVDRLRAEPNFADRPIVALVDPIPGCSCVHADDYGAGYLAGSHLLDLGHRHILHGYTPELEARLGASIFANNTDSNRISGIEKAYRERGLDPQQYLLSSLVPRADGPEDPPRASAMLQTLRQHPEITAMVAPNDLAAVSIWPHLIEAGYSIPRDMSVVSFDDTDPIISDTTGRNILTTVRIPLFEIGQEAARLILRAVNGQEQNLQDIVLKTQLIVRSSTAQPRK